MSNNIKFTFLSMILLFSVKFPLWADITSGSDFQKIPKSARAIALGESYTAAMDDMAAMDYNPAALNTMKKIGFSAMYQSWIDNSYSVYGAAGYRLGYLVLGGSFFYLNYGGIKEYDYFGNFVDSYDPYDMNVKAALSMDGGIITPFLKGFSVGACFSGIYRKLITETLWGFSMDTGLHYKSTLSQLFQIQNENFNETFGVMPINAGFSIQNIGFLGEFLAPLKFNLGICLGLFPDFYFSFDLSKDYNATPLLYKLGLEYIIAEILALRCGFAIGKDNGNFSFGIGLKYPFLLNNLRFDYAYSPLGVMGNNHSFSLYGEFLFEESSDDYYQKGLYYYNKKDYLKAREFWQKALELNPNEEPLIKKLQRVNEVILFYGLEPEVPTKNRHTITNENSIQSGVFISNQMAHFVFITEGDEVKNVSVTGDFNDWDYLSSPLKAEETNQLPYKIWKLSLKLKAGVYQYKFVLDGTNAVDDSNNPLFTSDGKGGKNSILNVTSFDTNENISK